MYHAKNEVKCLGVNGQHIKYTYEIYISSTDGSRELCNYFKRCKKKFFILNFQSIVLIPPQSVHKGVLR